MSLPPGLAAREVKDDMKLVAVFPREFPPIYTVTKNNLPTGFGIEFMEKLARETGMEIEYRPLPTWYDALEALKNGQADLIPNIGITAGRDRVFDFSRPIHSVPVSLFVKSSNDDIRGMDDLEGVITGVVRANVGQIILSRHPQIIEKDYLSLNDLYVGLLKGEVDAAIYPRTNFVQLGMELGTAKRVKTVGSPLLEVDRAIAVRQGNTELLARLDPAIGRLLQSPAYREMMNRWFPEPPPFWTTQRVVILLGLTLVITAILWQMYRVRILGHMNSVLARANTFSNAILDAASEGIISVDAGGRITSANEACENMFGMTEAELTGQSLHWLITGPDAGPLADSLRQYRDGPAETRRFNRHKIWECAARRADGALFPVGVGVVPMEIDGDLNFVCTLVDESRARQAETRAEQLLSHDPLTGLLNLHGFTQALDKIVNRRDAPRLACLCIGMQRLTYINGVYGRRVGDQLLLHAAAIIQEAAVRSNEKVELIGRTGGERFFVVISHKNEEAVLETSRDIAHQFDEFNVTYGDSRETIQADAHIGVAYFPEHGDTSEELIYHAELAFYSAREASFETVHVFNHEEKIEQSHAEFTLQRIRSALNNNRLILHYQPIKHIRSGTINHYEALVRLVDTDNSLVMPADIIPAAERFGMITRIDYRVMELIMKALPALQEKEPNIWIAVNLSAAHLGSSNLFAWLKDLFSKQAGAANGIIFEITESAALQNIMNIKKFMHELKELGCKFSLDDFGVGFTSFAQLRDLPVDIVKIDGLFVREITRNEEDRTLVRAITDVAHSLDKQVIAEFVEDEETYRLLAEYGVDYAQGYYIGKPGNEIFQNDIAT